LDVVAIMVILALILSGQLSPTAALEAGVSVYPFLMTVALAASTAFSTPVASPVNTLVLGPGGYRFNDFVKVGVPLQVLAMVVTLLVVPLLFPLR
jgi:di/tricarboxylate transporter